MKRFFKEIFFILVLAIIIGGTAVGFGWLARNNAEDVTNLSIVQMAGSGLVAVFICFIRFIRQIQYYRKHKRGSFVLLLLRPLIWALLICLFEVYAFALFRCVQLNEWNWEIRIQEINDSFGSVLLPGNLLGLASAIMGFYVMFLIVMVVFSVVKRNVLIKLLLSAVGIFAFISFIELTYPFVRQYLPVTIQYDLAVSAVMVFILASVLKRHKHFDKSVPPQQKSAATPPHKDGN